MTKIQRKALHTSLASMLIGGFYVIIFETPIYKLDLLSMAFVILMTAGFLGIIWKSVR